MFLLNMVLPLAVHLHCLHDFSVSPQAPWVFELIGTWFGLGLGGLGTKGLGPGLDNSCKSPLTWIKIKLNPLKEGAPSCCCCLDLPNQLFHHPSSLSSLITSPSQSLICALSSLSTHRYTDKDRYTSLLYLKRKHI